MLVDANVLLYAENEAAPHHEPCRSWLVEALNGPSRVALPWPSLLAFFRIRTNPRIHRSPLSADQAWVQVQAWLEAPNVWTPVPTDRHAEVLGALIARHRPTANLMPDVDLAALAIEHGLAICSADTDFARFSEVRWVDPTAT